MRLKRVASAIRYRVSGLPVSLANLRKPRTGSAADLLRHAYARRYWRFRNVGEAAEVLPALIVLPFLLLGTAIRLSATAGRGHAKRSGRPALLQFADQIRLYAAAGVLPASYYIYSLYEEPTVARARSFLKRSETKGMLYDLVREKMPPSSSLSDKAAFEERCRRHGLPVVPTIGVAAAGQLAAEVQLPPQDIFVKPLKGKGGRDAERWSFVGDGRFRSADGEELSAAALRERLGRRSREERFIVQPRIVNDPSLSDLNCGALATVRVLTCLDERGQPEVMGAALRMAVRTGSVVDNLHSGGVAADVEVETGELGAATNLGKDASIGWLDVHPVTGGAIRGRKLEWWSKVKDLALEAHRAFSDRLFVGWDIAMTPQGPVIVEANGSPDLDILQRCGRRGMADSRFAELLVHRLRQ